MHGRFGSKRQFRDQVLHRDRVVARAEAVLLIERMRLLDLDHVELDAEARRSRLRRRARL